MYFKRFDFILWGMVFVLMGVGLRAQNTSQSTITLQEVTLDAVKIQTPASILPFAVSRVDLTVQHGLQQQLSLQEFLEGVPGLFALNANNYAQDLRISLRGFGARAAFGIRGIKIIVDGIPETTPDGQGQVDNLPLGLLKNIEVLRGPSASLYGNASGGVLYLNTWDSLTHSTLKFKTTVGAFASQIHQLTASVGNEKTTALIYLNRTTTNGFRNFSGVEQNVVNLKIKHQFSNQSAFYTQLNYTLSPRAEDAGALTLAETDQIWNQARSRNVDYDTYEKINQLKVGLRWEQNWGSRWNWDTYGFYSSRDFYGKLPFEAEGIVDLFRNYSGLGSRMQYTEHHKNLLHQWQLGVETAFQSDLRKRFQNLMGKQGALGFSQTEYFNALGVYLVDALQWEKWLVRSSLRLDHQVLGADTVESAQTYQVLNPGIGVSYGIAQQQRIYTNISTSYETPALSELSANPEGGEGLNLDLLPSKAINYELGWKNLVTHGRMEATLFYSKSSNEILPYDLEAFPGRSFYRNSGATKRYGLELYGEAQWRKWQTVLSLTQAAYQFTDENTGKALPGLPNTLAYVQLQFHPTSDWRIQLTGEHIGQFYANDANTVSIDAFQKWRFQTQKQFSFRWGQLSWTAGINNVFNAPYFDNIRLNAFGGRFYEPAPKRNAYFGIAIEL